MRLLALLMVIVMSQLAVFSQQPPVQWSLSAVKQAEGVYLLELEGKLEKGWQVYATADSTIGLESVQMSWENQNISGKAPELRSVLRNFKDPLFGYKALKVHEEQISLKQIISIKGAVPERLSITVTGFASKADEFVPIEENIEVKLEGGVSGEDDKLSTINLEKPAADCGEKISDVKGNGWTVFLKGFAGGLIAFLMPCIFPMLPVTVSFFMNRAKTKKEGIRNGVLFGSFIFLIYVLASIPFHIAGNVNPQLFNILSTDKWVNLAFFAIFLLFALSLFGLFELKLPGANKTDRKSSPSSIAGIFFMALTLALVSFSCTGPILGFLLVNSINSSNGAWALTLGMAGFGAALALPFGLFAMFPQWMKKLPKSGGWMETLKKSLAFVELALAFKFFSNADMVEHWGILKREVFIGVWILITLGMALYLLGVFNKRQWNGLQNADTVQLLKPKLSGARILFGGLILLFAIYLVPGITQTKYANLKLVSGFPPPLSYSIYGKDNVEGKGVEPDVINDYKKALALSKQQNKPLLIDFTGWACVNCRKMEENVWTKDEIKSLIDSNFILVSLYVDDREKLEDGRTMGEKWASFQSTNFGSASQPQYVILSPSEELMNHPVGYSKERVYKEWLQCGIRAFEERKKLVRK